MEDEGKSFQDHLDAIWHRKYFFLLVVVVLLSASTIVIRSIDSVYRSTGLILIEQQEIPDEWVSTTVTSFAEERIQLITQRVMSTEKIKNLINKFDMFPKDREDIPFEQLTQRVRDSFNVETVNANASGRPGSAAAAIAFKVSYHSESPQQAYKIANEIVSLYLEENLKTRTEAATDTRIFLQHEADKLAEELANIEALDADFKETNMGSLPEQLASNQQSLDRAEQQVLDIEQSLRSLEERRTFLESSIAMARRFADSPSSTTEDTYTIDPEQRLEELRAEHLRLSTRYSEDHPDLIRLRRELKSLDEQLGNDPANRLSPNSPSEGIRNREAMDPTTLRMQAELDLIGEDFKALRNQRKQLNEKIGIFEQRIADTPRVGREYQALVRDVENIKVEYDELRRKQTGARVAESLEQERKGERFTLIDPPRVSKTPLNPPLKLFILSFSISILGALGSVVIFEYVDPRIRSSREAESIAEIPVLAVIPYIENQQDRSRFVRNVTLSVLAVFLVIITAATFIHVYYKPLDSVWYSILDRIALLEKAE